MENIEIDLAYAIRQLQFALDHVPNENMRLGDKAGIIEDCLRRANDAMERIESNLQEMNL